MDCVDFEKMYVTRDFSPLVARSHWASTLYDRL